MFDTQLMDEIKKVDTDLFYEMSDYEHEEATLHFWKQGVKSEFPICCISFFTSIWSERFRSQFLTNQNEWGWGDGKGRIFCPDCIVGKLV